MSTNKFVPVDLRNNAPIEKLYTSYLKITLESPFFMMMATQYYSPQPQHMSFYNQASGDICKHALKQTIHSSKNSISLCFFVLLHSTIFLSNVN